MINMPIQPLFGDDIRGRILQGTAEVVSDKGVRDTTVQDILNAAGVARRTFYKSFDSKADALRVLFEMGTQLMLVTIEMAVTAALTPVEKLTRAIDAYLDLQRSGGRLIIALQTEAVRPDSLLAPRREVVLQRLIDLIDDNFFHAYGERLDPLVARTLLLGMEGLVIHLHQAGPFNTAARDHVRDVFLPIMFRTLAMPNMQVPELPRAVTDLA